MKYLFILFVVIYSSQVSAQVNKKLIPYRVGDKWGYVNRNHKIKIKPQFDSATFFIKKRAVVTIDDSNYIIDPQANIVKGFFRNYSIENDFIWVENHNGFDRFDLNFNPVLEGFTNVRPIDGSRLFAYRGENDLKGLALKKGKVIVPAFYDDIRTMHNGLIAVKKDNKWGFINKHGKVIIPLIYDYCGDFRKTIATVNLSGKDMSFLGLQGGWQLITKNGKYVLDTFYRDLGWAGCNTIYVFSKGKIGYLNKNLKLVIPQEFDDTRMMCSQSPYSCGVFNNRVSLLRKDKLAFVKRNGTFLTDHIFDRIYLSDECLKYKYWLVLEENKFGIIDRNANYVLKSIYNWIEVLDRNHFLVKKDSLFNIIGKKGKKLFQNDFEYVEKVANNKYIVQLNGKNNLINKKGEYLLPEYYDDIKESSGFFILEKGFGPDSVLVGNKKIFLKNYHGEALIDKKNNFVVAPQKGLQIGRVYTFRDFHKIYHVSYRDSMNNFQSILLHANQNKVIHKNIQEVNNEFFIDNWRMIKEKFILIKVNDKWCWVDVKGNKYYKFEED